ncbi:hypothetical protein [uncultured Gammaproteobacteria bacterium]|nr:hypothetical protein [uncultured Gammaproteobacteria bacterium]
MAKWGGFGLVWLVWVFKGRLINTTLSFEDLSNANTLIVL